MKVSATALHPTAVDRWCMPLLTCGAMADLDAAAQSEAGIPGLILMENAARSAWDLVRDQFGIERETAAAGDLVFVAGAGNNGGDALVMARHAHCAGFPAQLIILREPSAEAAALQLSICRALGIAVSNWQIEREAAQQTITAARWIVDGIAGTGLKGPLRAEAATLVAALNNAAGRVAAVDLPSGAYDNWISGPCVNADLTVSTGPRKRCLYEPQLRSRCGTVADAFVGFPPALLRGAAVAAWLVANQPPLQLFAPEAYKGTRGRVAVVGGGVGTGGAAVLAASAALHAGGGMVSVVADIETATLAVRHDPAIMTRDPREVETVCAWADALVIGPGWTGAERTDLQRWLAAAAQRNLPVTVDAAALRLMGSLDHADVPAFRATIGSDDWWREKVILTPHIGELRALFGDNDSGGTSLWEMLERVARLWRCTIVAKDAVTVVKGPDTTFVCDVRNPYLGTAGAGDVLAGIVGALAAVTEGIALAAIGAVWLHRDAAIRAAQSFGVFSAAQLAAAVGWAARARFASGEVDGRL